MADPAAPTRLKGWWSLRSPRERMLLLVMAALAALVLVWLLAIRPLVDARAGAEARLAAAVADLGQARAQMPSAQPGGPGAAQIPLPLDGYLMQQAGEAGLVALQVSGQGADRATVSAANVRPQAFLGWIGQLESRGIVIESLSARANADQTIAVQAVLKAGGA